MCTASAAAPDAPAASTVESHNAGKLLILFHVSIGMSETNHDITAVPCARVVGHHVVRGPDWAYGDQDGGAGSIGVVQSADGEHPGWVTVKWLGGRSTVALICLCSSHDVMIFSHRAVWHIPLVC